MKFECNICYKNICFRDVLRCLVPILRDRLTAEAAALAAMPGGRARQGDVPAWDPDGRRGTAPTAEEPMGCCCCSTVVVGTAAAFDCI